MENKVHALIKYKAVNIVTQNKTRIEYKTFYVKHIMSALCMKYTILIKLT